jgi:hypothetical protein
MHPTLVAHTGACRGVPSASRPQTIASEALFGGFHTLLNCRSVFPPRPGAPAPKPRDRPYEIEAAFQPRGTSRSGLRSPARHVPRIASRVVATPPARRYHDAMGSHMNAICGLMATHSYTLLRSRRIAPRSRFRRWRCGVSDDPMAPLVQVSAARPAATTRRSRSRTPKGPMCLPRRAQGRAPAAAGAAPR